MISVTILTKNSSLYIEQVLQSLTRFDEVLVYDTGSTDATMQIVKRFNNVRLEQGAFIGFGPTHNKASALTSHDWVLSIDSDEIATRELVDEIFALQLDAQYAYSIPRDNFYRGKHIKGCGWYPDRVVRLYNKTKTYFSDDLVHERILIEQISPKALQSALIHHPYNSIEDFLRKMQNYTTLFAEQHSGKKRASLSTALSHGFAAFLKSYFLKKGCLLGAEGLEISLYNAITAYYKYLKLRDSSSKTRL